MCKSSQPFVKGSAGQDETWNCTSEICYWAIPFKSSYADGLPELARKFHFSGNIMIRAVLSAVGAHFSCLSRVSTILFSLVLLSPSLVSAKSQSDCERFQSLFPRVAILAASPRGGVGESFAAYSTALDFIRNCMPHQALTMISPDQKTDKHFGTLAAFAREIEGRVQYATVEELYAGEVPFDILIAPARGGIEDAHFTELSRRQNALIAELPVFSNSEDLLASSQSRWHYQGNLFKRTAPGVGIHELGYYYNPAIASVVNWDRDQLIARLIEWSERSGIPELANMLLRQAARASTRLGFAYGITKPVTRMQWNRYLQDLYEEARAKGGRTVIFTPSSVDFENLYNLQLNDIFVGYEHVSKPRAILPSDVLSVVELPPVPLEIFTGLMRLSHLDGIVPLGAGDGFVSTAVGLGIPFAMTFTLFNKPVAKELAQTLQVLVGERASGRTSDQARKIVRQAFIPGAKTPGMPSSKANVQELKNLGEIFRELPLRLPKLSDSILREAVALRTGTVSKKKSCARLLVSDN